jgi:hypothetical protein
VASGPSAICVALQALLKLCRFRNYHPAFKGRVFVDDSTPPHLLVSAAMHSLARAQLAVNHQGMVPIMHSWQLILMFVQVATASMVQAHIKDQHITVSVCAVEASRTAPCCC